MVAIVAALAGATIQVVKWAAKPIIRQFSYLCCFASNIDGLKQEADELDMATRGLQGQVDRERENVRVILPQVESWLTKSNDIKGQKDAILDQVPNVESGCFKIGARYGLSKRALDTTDRMKELRIQKNFDPISVQGPPAATQEIPIGKTYEFESRKKFEEDIMTTLRDGDANIVGIYGMGGLGKTTMAQKIMNRALKEHVFEEVVMAVISQQVDMSNVQVEIGGSLGLDLQHEASQVRVQKLHARLTGGMKRILLVLDDVWEGLELHNLGIPCESKQCKILVTSRNMDALSEMDVQKIFGMKVLPPKDAWFLFRERAGRCVDDVRLNVIAKEVLDECGGLPIALTTVGAALKDEKDESIWKDALRQLRQCDPNIPGYIAKVYNPLKLSYDFLRSRQAESVLLLCCLCPEDAMIPLETLTYFCMGLGIFEHNLNLEGARNKMRSLAKMLKSRSLLLDGFSFFGEDNVRMHDVVRDVCKIIAKQGGFIGGNDCAWISSSELIGKRRSGLGFSNLRLLFLIHDSKLDEEFKFGRVFLEGIRDLHVMWIKQSTLTSLPLRNLNTLVLDSCEGLETISVVGELVNIEILICRNCRLLEELPTEIKGLNRLKLLDLTSCYMLQSIGRGIISSLVGLEELKMLNSFKKWEAEDREERKNAALKELQALINLTCLEIEIEDPALVVENMHISTKLERFCITFPKMIPLPSKFHSYNKVMSLNLERETCLGYWIEMQLLRETELLWLLGNGAKNVDLGKSQNIKWLMLSECETAKNIVTTPSYDDVDATVFPPSLEYVELRSLPQLQEISYASFQNLTSILIIDCPRLLNLAKLPMAGKDWLSQLQELRIERCEKMEQVFLRKENDNNSESRTNPHVKFPKLKEVWLVSLPNLVTFCQGIEGIEFSLLREIHIEKCPKWTSMVSSSGILRSKENEPGGGSSSSNIHDEYSAHLFCQLEKVSFGNLKELTIDRNPFCGHQICVSSSYSGLETLRISNYHERRSLLSSSIVRNLVNLKTLSIKECDEMVQVIKDDDDEEEEDKTRIISANSASGGERAAALFPELRELSLNDLPKLVSFCELKCDHVVLPLLRSADIKKCPKMKKSNLVAPNLQLFTTDSNMNDLGVDVIIHALERLKILSIEEVGNENYKFPNKFLLRRFDGIKELYLNTRGSMSLFSCSIAGKLVNLQSLLISSCDEMVKVIEEEVEVRGVLTTLVFPKLEDLCLSKSPKLVSFCESRKCAVELPSLRKVTVLHCSSMKYFSLGPLTAPNLEFIKVDSNDIGGAKDLNSALQQHYSARAKKSRGK